MSVSWDDVPYGIKIMDDVENGSVVITYYGFDASGGPTDQYFEQPHEVAVQYMVIKCANVCLSSVYDRMK